MRGRYNPLLHSDAGLADLAPSERQSYSCLVQSSCRPARVSSKLLYRHLMNLESQRQQAATPIRPTREDRLVALLVGASTVGLSLWLAAQVLDRATQPVYLIPKVGQVFVIGAVVATLASSITSLLLSRGWVMFLVAGAFLIIFLGILLTLLGVPLVAIGVGMFVLVFRLLPGARSRQRRTILILGGVTAMSLSLLFMAWNHPPLVDCSTGRVSATYWYWGGSPSRTSGSAHTSPDGETRGVERFGGNAYSFVCRDGKLVEFGVSG